MSYRDANLTQRTGYPTRTGRASHLDVPMADEYSPYGSEDDKYKAGAGGGAGAGGKGGGSKGKKGPRSRESVVARLVREASFYTKATYVWLLASLLLFYLGYRSIIYNSGSVWLSCTARMCDLEITPPQRAKRTKVTFHRTQIVRADVIKVDGEGNVRATETVSTTRDVWSTAAGPGEGGGGGGKKGKYPKYQHADLGPDQDGLYESYLLVLKEQERSGGGGSGGFGAASEGEGGASSMDPNSEQTQRGGGGTDTDTGKSLLPLFGIAEPNEAGEYHVDMRMFNRGQTRRRAHSMVTRINAYRLSRRHKLSIRENRNVTWQGVVLVVVGVFSFVLCLLLGQFCEPSEDDFATPSPPTRRGPRGRASGAGARRAPTSASARSRQQAPTGYGSYGGYRPQSQGGGGGGGAGVATSSSSSPTLSRTKGGSSAGYGTYGGYRPQSSRR